MAVTLIIIVIVSLTIGTNIGFMALTILTMGKKSKEDEVRDDRKQIAYLKAWRAHRSQRRAANSRF